MLKAQCQCGSLRAEVEGELEAVVMCSCIACQRRTGSAFGEGAYASRDRVKLSGAATEFVRSTDAGHQFHEFFCPTCGTTLYFYSSRGPERLGIAVGCIEGAPKLKPVRSVFEATKHEWVSLGDEMPGFIGGRDSARTR